MTDVLDELREAAARKWAGDPAAQRAGLFARAAEEVDALRKDAERYRWLRDKADPDSNQPYVTVYKKNSWGKWFNSVEIGSFLDAAIDAAIDAARGK